MGDRVCVDTCSMLVDGDGMLMGNTSSAMLLVHAETLENPYVAPRPFRVNAGAVHAYILLPDGKTAYLSDLSIGGQVLVSDAKARPVPRLWAGRRSSAGPCSSWRRSRQGGAKASLILQNAETIRLVTPDGSAISVVNLAAGERSLAVRSKAAGILACRSKRRSARSEHEGRHYRRDRKDGPAFCPGL